MADYGSMRDEGVRFAGFSPTELFSLSEAVAANVGALGSAARLLERSTRQLGSRKDSRQLRDEANETQQDISAVITTTTKDLRRLGDLVRRGDKRQKLQVEKLTQSFTESVTKYSTIQKQFLEKIQVHIMKKPMPMADFTAENVGEEDDDTARLIAQQQAQNRILEFESGMLEEREAYVREIESKVVDVNQIMQELGSIVNTQGVTIDTIENAIETAGGNVEAGHEELIKASRYTAKFRRKMFILVGIALIVGIVLTIIIVTSLKR